MPWSLAYILSAILNSGQHKEWTELLCSGIDQSERGGSGTVPETGTATDPDARSGGKSASAAAQPSLVLRSPQALFDAIALFTALRWRTGLKKQAPAVREARGAGCFLK